MVEPAVARNGLAWAVRAPVAELTLPAMATAQSA
jgi:hypothetical protein